MLTRRGLSGGKQTPRPNLSKRGKPHVSRRRDSCASESRTGKHQRWLKWLALIGCLCLTVWGGVVLAREYSQEIEAWFEIRHVRVVGAVHLTHEEVLNQLNLRPGETLFSLDFGDALSRLRGHRWIKEASLRRIPFHDLEIRLVEREAAAILKGSRSHVFVDNQGMVLSEVRNHETLQLPLLRGINPGQLLKEERQAKRAVLAGLQVATLLGDVFTSRPEIYVGNPLNIVALVKGLRIHFGASPFDEKWDLYQKIHPAIPSSIRAETGEWSGEIDLRYPSKVIVRERGS